MAQMLYPTFVNSRFYQHLSKTSAIRLAPTAHNSGKLFRDYSLVDVSGTGKGFFQIGDRFDGEAVAGQAETAETLE